MKHRTEIIISRSLFRELEEELEIIRMVAAVPGLGGGYKVSEHQAERFAHVLDQAARSVRGALAEERNREEVS